MKGLALVLLLTFAFTTAKAQKSKCVPTTTPPRDHQVRLQLTTSIAEAHYSTEYGPKSLVLRLNLNYQNVGTRPILLDKKSSRIYRKIVTKNLKALAACKYLYDASSHAISTEDMTRAGFRFSDPEQSEFVTLEPGKSLRMEREIALSLYDGTKDTKDDLHPGNYVLQVRVAAWFYFADPAEWEQKWGNEAYLWSENVTSEPMAFTVEKR